MTTTLTTRERMRRAYDHQEGDRVPITDSLWGATRDRWTREGLAAGADWVEHFDLDRIQTIRPDNSPRFPEEILEEGADYRIRRTAWGATIKEFTDHGGVPEYLGFTITDPDAWREAKARMQPDRDRIDWGRLQRDFKQWRERGDWIQAGLWFGFDVTHSHMVGTERVLEAMIEEPEWMVDMFEHELSVGLALLDQVWEAGYHFDAISWPDDMGYKLSQFFSLSMYRELLKPVHARAARWAHERGVRVHLHSCGDIRPFVPDLIEIGIEMLNPLEVKAGVDPLWMKQTYGDRIGLHGGLNAVLFGNMDRMEAQMREFLPTLKAGGGYWLSSDHSIPDSVSLADFGRFVALAKELGSYA